LDAATQFASSGSTAGISTARGGPKAAVHRNVRSRFKLLNLFGFGNKVVTERLDCWDWDGKGFTLKLPVCGMFELNEAGKIYEWREYYDNEH
jgi:limonene-1,2-epoxide hydrolase